MSSTNSGPSVTSTPNVVVQAVPAGGSSVPFDPSSVAITGGTIAVSNGALVTSGMRAAVLGDSISDAYVYGSTGTTSTRKSSGWLTWLNILSGQRFYFDQSLNFAVSGYNTTDLIANKLAACIAAKPQVCFVMIGTNDCGQLVSPASIIANLSTIYAALTTAGIQVIAIPILARSSWSSLSAPQIIQARQTQYQVNAWIRSKARSGSGIFLADPSKYWIDPSSATGDPVAARVQDGLHPSSPNGGYFLGKGIWADLQGMFPGGAQLDYSALNPAVGYDATYNPYANLLLNGTFQGTAGTTQAPGTGTTPDSWISQRRAGSAGTMAGSQESPRGDGLPGTRAKFVIGSGAGATNEQYVLLQVVSSNISAGQTFQAACGVDISACTNARNVGLEAQVKTAGGSTLFTAFAGEVGAMPDENWSGILATEPFVVPATGARIDIYLTMTVDGTLATPAMTVKPSWARLAQVLPASAIQ